MSAYGKIISGGKAMTKGLTKSINDKLDSLEDRRERQNTVAGAVNRAFTQKNLSDNSTNNVKGGTFKKVKATTNV